MAGSGSEHLKEMWLANQLRGRIARRDDRPVQPAIRLKSHGRVGRCIILACTLATLALVQIWAASAAEEQDQTLGRLVGRFVFDGTPPEPKPLEILKDLEFFRDKPSVDESLVVDKNGGLANVVVVLRSPDVVVPEAVAARVPAKVNVQMKDGRFAPHISLVWAGKQEVVFENEDPFGYCYLLKSRVNPTAQLVPTQRTTSQTFSRGERAPAHLSCMIHPWMNGAIVIHDNPYFAVSGPDGTFRIDGLPPGEWEFQAWHERSGYLNTAAWPKGRFTMKVVAGENQLGEIKLSPDLFARQEPAKTNDR